MYVLFPFYFESVYTIHYIGFNAGVFIYCFANMKILYKLWDELAAIQSFLKIGFIIWCGLFLFTIIIIVVSGTFDVGFFKFVFAIPRDIARSLALAIIVCKYYLPQERFEAFAKRYVTACMLYVFVTSFMLINPDFRIWWTEIVHQIGADRTWIFEGGYIPEITRVGLQGFSGIYCSLNCTFGVIFYIYYLMSTHKGKFINFIPIVILVIGNLFYGRTALIISLLCIIIFYIYLQLKMPKLGTKIVAIAFIFISILGILISENEYVSEWSSWSIEPIKGVYNYAIGDSDKLSLGESGDELRTLYKMPDFDILLYGEGIFDPVGYTENFRNDVGWIRITYFGGVLGTILYYSNILILFLALIKLWSKSKRNAQLMLSLMTMLSFFLFESKGTNMNTHIGYIVMEFFMISTFALKNQIDHVEKMFGGKQK